MGRRNLDQGPEEWFKGKAERALGAVAIRFSLARVRNIWSGGTRFCLTNHSPPGGGPAVGGNVYFSKSTGDGHGKARVKNWLMLFLTLLRSLVSSCFDGRLFVSSWLQ